MLTGLADLNPKERNKKRLEMKFQEFKAAQDKKKKIILEQKIQEHQKFLEL